MAWALYHYDGHKWAHKPADIPTEPHWVILTEGHYTEHTGYENEGHYGGSQPKVEYHFWMKEEQWRTVVTALFREQPDRKDIRCFKVTPVVPKVTVTVEVTDA